MWGVSVRRSRAGTVVDIGMCTEGRHCACQGPAADKVARLNRQTDSLRQRPSKPPTSMEKDYSHVKMPASGVRGTGNVEGVVCPR